MIQFRHGRPPNFDAIAAVLPGAYGSDTVFTYGDVIYVANGTELSKAIVAHETVHVMQQEIIGRDAWWDGYLADKAFRFQMELAAHRMEWTVARAEGNRHARRRMEKLIAQRLAGPLYGHACSLVKARRLLEETVGDGGNL